MGGSYYVESLTDSLEEEAESYFKTIKSMGGMVAAIEDGYPQREIISSANRFQAQIETKDRIITGVNKFMGTEGNDVKTLRVEPRLEIEQRDRLASVRKGRNKTLTNDSLNELKLALENEENIMPFLLTSVKSYASLGEIVRVIQDVHGLYDEPATF